MNFFKSVFADDPEPSDLEENQMSVTEPPRGESEEGEEDPDREALLEKHDSSPRPNSKPAGGGGWSFGSLIKTIATKSESVLDTYRRDLEEFGSGLKKETATIREVASRAVKELPVSIETGASVAQGSLESVGQAIDDFGSSVWRGTTEIITQGKDVLLNPDLESDSSDSQYLGSQTSNSKRYSRFDAQLHVIQTDLNTYCEEPEDLDDFNNWKLGFALVDKAEEIEDLFEANGIVQGIYTKLVPNSIDRETFWSRYFYRVHKLKQAEDARANLVKRVISREDEEDLSWDVDDDDNEESNMPELRVDSMENRELEKKDSPETVTEKCAEESQVGSSEVVVDEVKNNSGKTDEKDISDGKMPLEGKADLLEESTAKSDEKMFLEGKNDNGESSKDSDVSVVSTQPSFPEEEDLGWDEIEDIGSNDEKKISTGGSPNRADLRKRLSAAEEDEDLSWDIEDDDEPIKH